MGFFKKRHGEMAATDAGGRSFVWRLPGFSSFRLDTVLDSTNVVAFTMVKFHLHMTIDISGNTGLYIHYKATGIPKYSYYFSNSQGEVMRQQTAHTIPSNTKRCGHWNTCCRPDILEFISADDVLLVKFVFDDDCLTVSRTPQPNVLQVIWMVPHLFTQMLNPYSSQGFSAGGANFVMRLEIKKEFGAIDAVGPYTVDNIKDLVFFLFCRKQEVPPHSIELLDGSGACIAKLDMKGTPGVQTLTVPKQQLWDALGNQGTLTVRVKLQCRCNPIDALNALSEAQQLLPQGEGSLAVNATTPPGTVQIGSKREEYVVFRGDD
ncbi:hypothetical protein TraAM80_08363 [Trypanosoma rangeli]|uniref:Uncharacterized protein n=1 Tax=Trypanosoma rangeli TaxID=5698 RepID=A0A3R7N2S2_TRYRA|nr:uncharacterized protein TraAM80_08363 [Trypanosoma rangeli]RNE99136.1 hypothetical protein TraAM80_08363 [Trypanosoma rangeli]|eukprot:RNE99136.1 hypothetical protein TraAM80_08363 [Trypanosoma rangeli]